MSVRVGLVGYGLAGEVFHAPLIAATPGLELTAVATTRAERVRAAFPDAAVVRELWAEDVDLAVVAAPNRVHVELALAAVERGIPVVVDKPLAPTLDEARRAVEAAEPRPMRGGRGAPTRLELEDLAEAIRDGGPPRLGREDALGQARVLEALLS